MKRIFALALVASLLIAAPVAAKPSDINCSLDKSVVAYGETFTVSGNSGKTNPGVVGFYIEGAQQGFIANEAAYYADDGSYSVELVSGASISGDLVTVRVYAFKPSRQASCSYTVG